VVFYLGKASLAAVVRRIGSERSILDDRVHYTTAVLTFIWGALVVIIAGFLIGIGYQDVGLFFGSMVAVLGVALFAQWSILSNVTASIVVFFFFPYRVGHYVRIIDDKNTVEGVITEITLFHVILEGKKNEVITYPNAMVFQKAVSINPQPAVESDNNQNTGVMQKVSDER
jgi:small-conductance mechanosensitive channel